MCNAAVSDGCDADGLPAIGELVDDPERADSKRVQPAQLAAQRVAGLGFALEEAQRILDRVDEGPVELEQLAASPAGKD